MERAPATPSSNSLQWSGAARPLLESDVAGGTSLSCAPNNVRENKRRNTRHRLRPCSSIVDRERTYSTRGRWNLPAFSIQQHVGRTVSERRITYTELHCLGQFILVLLATSRPAMRGMMISTSTSFLLHTNVGTINFPPAGISLYSSALAAS